MSIFKPQYTASAAVNFGTTLNALASSSTWTAGAQSAEIDNTSNLYDDVLLSGSFKMGTSPTAGTQINVYIVACLDGSSAYPDVITNAGAAAKTWTSQNVQIAAAVIAVSILVDSTTGRVFAFSNVSIASLFGGVLPQKFVVFVAHDAGVALDASAGGSLNVLGINFQAL